MMSSLQHQRLSSSVDISSFAAAPRVRGPRPAPQPWMAQRVPVPVACAHRAEGPAPAAPGAGVRGPRVSELTTQRIALYRLLAMGTTAVAGSALVGAVRHHGAVLAGHPLALLGVGIGLHAAYHLAFSRDETPAQAVRTSKAFHLHGALPFLGYNYDEDLAAVWLLPIDVLSTCLSAAASASGAEAVPPLGMVIFGFLATAILKGQLFKRPSQDEAIKNAWACHQVGDMDGLCDWVDELTATGNAYAYEQAGDMLLAMDRKPWAAAMFRVAFLKTFDNAAAFVNNKGESYLRARLGHLQALYNKALGHEPQAEPVRPRAPAPRAWHEVLGVPAYASLAQVKAAYRGLAKERHPDKGGSNEDMVELQQAYERAKAKFN